MSALSPSVWYLIAMIVGAIGTVAAVPAFRRHQPDWIAMAIAVVGLGGAFGIVIALPAPPAAALPLATIAVGGVLILDVLRKAFIRRRSRTSNSHRRSPAGPPDIENIP